MSGKCTGLRVFYRMMENDEDEPEPEDAPGLDGVRNIHIEVISMCLADRKDL